MISSNPISNVAGSLPLAQTRDLMFQGLPKLDSVHVGNPAAPPININFPAADTDSDSNTTAHQNPELRKAFSNFVGQTFFGQMLSAMRKTVDKPAYFHGGRAEEVFQGQLDQVLAEKMSEATADQFAGPMFDLFTMNRK